MLPNFKFIVGCFALQLFFSSKELDNERKDISKQERVEIPVEKLPTNKETNSALQEHSDYGNNLVLDLDGVKIYIEDFMIYDQNIILNAGQDTVTIKAKVGESIHGKTISITSESLRNISIEQRYETSVTISNEGAHCDLLGWKHYTSKWTTLKMNVSGKFSTQQYSKKDLKMFPYVNASELRDIVRKSCGNEWKEIALNIESPNEYPASVTVSRYFLKISGEQLGTNNKMSKIIVIQMPMGG